jgi:hypothetical protein
MSDPLAELEHELRAEPPPAIAALTPPELETLYRALADARSAQNEALAKAVDDGLGFLPRIMRGAVKRALVG